MKFSAVIPAYNAAATIGATLESVFAQTLAPDEILVVDDGSTDDTSARLRAYEPRITVIRQSNRGAACARNELCEHARGEVLAFLDADDLWHPEYLATQRAALEKYPEVVASFTGHVNFYGDNGYSWMDPTPARKPDFELIGPLRFLEQYNHCAGPFGISYCCIPKRVLNQIGNEPFPVKVNGAEDFHLMNVLPLHGPVLYADVPLAAYRQTPGSMSSNVLKVVGVAVKAFENLEEVYTDPAAQKFRQVFNNAHASKRRQYAKFLMGVGKYSEARMQLKASLVKSADPRSRAKSLALLASTYLPRPVQPRWPVPYRQ